MIVYFDEYDLITEEILKQMMIHLPPNYRRKVELSRKKETKVQRTIAYMLLKYCVTEEYPGEKTGDFSYEEHGKPFIEGVGYHFNLTHTKSAAACVISDMPVGIDIQDIITDEKKVMKKACCAAEIKRLAESEDPRREFTKLWTLKEAYVKQKGSGIWDSIDQLDFSERKGNPLVKGNRFFYIIEENRYVIAVCLEKTGHLTRKICLSDLVI